MSINRRRIAVLGASGNALDILDIVDALGGGWELVGVFDDISSPGSNFAGLPILGRLSEATAMAAPGGLMDGGYFVNAIASERSHRQKSDTLAALQIDVTRFATLVHPLSAVSQRATLGCGVCIGPGSTVSGRVSIAEHVWLGAQVTIGHDTVIGVGATIAPRVTLAGGVRLGALTYVGSGAVLRPGIEIGDGALIGMGAVVLRDVPAGAIVVGNPARRYDL